MWLLKLPFSISVLCLLTFVGVRMVCIEQLKENGYFSDEKKKKKERQFMWEDSQITIFDYLETIENQGRSETEEC